MGAPWRFAASRQTCAGGESGLRVTLHAWQPQGRPYDGLPDSLDEAYRRIRERFVVEQIAPDAAPEPLTPPVAAVSEYCLDLRRV